jgi:hypothetical protein
MTSIKEKYELLRKKHNLPGFDELNREFDIEEISDETQLLAQKIREKIHEKFESYARMFESMLQPESSLSDMYEAHYIEDSEKNNAYAVFKRLMKIIRCSSSVAINNTEEENAAFIKDAHHEWNQIKPDVSRQVKRLISIWDKETDIKEDLNYFG